MSEMNLSLLGNFLFNFALLVKLCVDILLNNVFVICFMLVGNDLCEFIYYAV